MTDAIAFPANFDSNSAITCGKLVNLAYKIYQGWSQGKPAQGEFKFSCPNENISDYCNPPHSAAAFLNNFTTPDIIRGTVPLLFFFA